MSPPPEPKDPLLVLIYPEFTEFEISVATTLLSRRYLLQYVAPTLAPVRSEGGLQVLPDLTLEQVVPEQSAALIVSATPDMQSALENAAILDLIRAMDQAGKIVAAICGAPMLLAKAGVLPKSSPECPPCFNQGMKGLPLARLFWQAWCAILVTRTIALDAPARGTHACPEPNR